MHDHHSATAPAFRLPDFLKFAAFTGSQFVLALFVFKWVAPDEFAREFAQPWAIVLWTFLLGIPLSLFEYLYHRYLLHSAVLPFLRSMNRAHSHHHGLTAVKAPVTPKDPDMLVEVFNEYPIESVEQEESMMFPVYAISIFYVVFLILLALPFKLLFPTQPLVVSTLMTSTLCYSAYELWHQVLHLPFEGFWKPMMQGRRRRFVRHVYAFHLMHHWRPTCNLAVVGFWGLAIWDHIFGTHRRPHHLPVRGAKVNYNDVKLGEPRWPISMLDGWMPAMFKFSRRMEQALARIFLGRKTAR